ncbi:hypothetical protein LOCC1_G005676 [Lachnellula occidentalis]|uniref:DSBA-like thioredoxin domain-containing protein n=1 Tax=Lachnellula occidentalis TaxID=215460 RepID=A0A8H8RTX8_9HELO|nr:hypothetical protein LOCC1_G005676 [Lachnellula occidentalis]
MYDSTIDFTLDTICPWTYLAKKRQTRRRYDNPPRLDSQATYDFSQPITCHHKHVIQPPFHPHPSLTYSPLPPALRRVRETDASSKVTFTIKYLPYQLYPTASQTGEDKYEWYKKSRYGDSAEKMQMYTTLMTAYGLSAGIHFKFAGTVANTLQAHRLIQHFQSVSGPETADKLVASLYHLYFEEEAHPSSPETLLAASKVAGIDEAEAKAFIDDDQKGLPELKALIGEEAGNVSDQVPVVRIEGRRRDLTITGANEVDDYVKALMQIVKESE